MQVGEEILLLKPEAGGGTPKTGLADFTNLGVGAAQPKTIETRLEYSTI